MRGTYRLAILLLPFSGIAPLLPIGELKNEASAYVFLILLGLACFQSGKIVRQVRRLPMPFMFFFAAFMAVVALSAATNITSISDDVFRDRTAYEKFLTSTLTIMFGFLIAALTAYVASTNVATDLIRPLFLSTAICAAVAALEMASWVSADFDRIIYEPLSAVVHSGSGFLNYPERLRSVSAEASFFAIFQSFALPWLIAGYRLGLRPRSGYLLLIVAAIAMLVLAQSRTGYILLAGVLLLELLVRRRSLSAARGPSARFFFVTPMIVVAVAAAIYLLTINFSEVFREVISGANISNISRLASIQTALKIFFANPIFGVGLGQYAFHAAQVLPSWAYESYEIVNWFGDYGATWPPVYALHARLAAELGVLGLAAWYGFWIYVFVQVLKTVWTGRRANPVLGVAILQCIAVVLLSGLAFDSFRSFPIWITLGAASVFLAHARSKAGIPQRHAKAGRSAGVGAAPR